MLPAAMAAPTAGLAVLWVRPSPVNSGSTVTSERSTYTSRESTPPDSRVPGRSNCRAAASYWRSPLARVRSKSSGVVGGSRSRLGDMSPALVCAKAAITSGASSPR
ncbi:hypothetical protein LUW77_03985 [Streptomyces radiopugnans]|nr:hypothetical protein LUW77_03985 [Streptomyces radiopugnans]